MKKFIVPAGEKLLGGIPFEDVRYAVVTNGGLYVTDGYRAHCHLPVPTWLTDKPDNFAIEQRPDGRDGKCLMETDTAVIARRAFEFLHTRTSWGSQVHTRLAAPVDLPKHWREQVRRDGFYANRPNKFAAAENVPVGSKRLFPVLSSPYGQTRVTFCVGSDTGPVVVDSASEPYELTLPGYYNLPSKCGGILQSYWNDACKVVGVGACVRFDPEAGMLTPVLLGSSESAPHAFIMPRRGFQ